MLGAERELQVVARELTWQRNDNRRLRQREQETLRYREIPSRVISLAIEVIVVIFSEVMSTALKRPDDTLCRMRVDVSVASDLPALARRFCDSLQRLLALDHGQFNSLFIFEANFFERLKYSVLIHRVKGSCHERPHWEQRIA